MNIRKRSHDAATALRQHLLARLGSGELQPGDRLPTERDLSETFGSGRATIRRAAGDQQEIRQVDAGAKLGCIFKTLHHQKTAAAKNAAGQPAGVGTDERKERHAGAFRLSQGKSERAFP